MTLLASGLAGATSSCDVARPDATPVGPPLHVTAIQATFVDPNGAAWGDLADRTDVPVNARISIRFDRYLDPLSAPRRQSICLSTNLDDRIEKFTDCTSPAVLVPSPSYDPVERRVTYDFGTLTPNTRYQLAIFSAAEGGLGFQAFDGAALELRDQDRQRWSGASGDTHVVRIQFTTSAATVGLLPGEDAAGLYCSALGLLKTGCVDCHDAGGPMGMSLGRVGLVTTVVGVGAHETELGGRGASPAAAPPRFGTRMARVFAGDPGNSYLLYKILAGSGDWADASSDIAAGETDRLRLSVVSGMPMPPPPKPPDPTTGLPAPAKPFGRTELLTLSRWIANGAHVVDCKGDD